MFLGEIRDLSGNCVSSSGFYFVYDSVHILLCCILRVIDKSSIYETGKTIYKDFLLILAIVFFNCLLLFNGDPLYRRLNSYCDAVL